MPIVSKDNTINVVFDHDITVSAGLNRQTDKAEVAFVELSNPLDGHIIFFCFNSEKSIDTVIEALTSAKKRLGAKSVCNKEIFGF